MHGSPCQDFSLAGKQAGGDEGSGTRSSLMYETLRIVKDIKPKYVLWENVKNLLSVKHKHNFDAYIESMNELGYTSYYKVLNAKDFGIPQNRERVFTISIRNDLNKTYVFPESIELKLKLKDLLEKDVDEKYYLSQKMMNYVLSTNEDGSEDNRAFFDETISGTVPTSRGIPKVLLNSEQLNGQLTLDLNDDVLRVKNATKQGYLEAQEGDGIDISSRMESHRGTVQKDSCQTITCQGGNNVGVVVKDNRADYVLKQVVESNQIKDLPACCDSTINDPKVREISNCITSRYNAGIQTQKQIGLCVIDKDERNLKEQLCDYLIENNKVQENDVIRHSYSSSRMNNFYTNNSENNNENNNTSPTLDIRCDCLGVTVKDEEQMSKLRIRKLTPKECWRLMGFSDECFEKAKQVNSDSQLYKQAGNSIVVNVLEKILGNLLED